MAHKHRLVQIRTYRQVLRHPKRRKSQAEQFEICFFCWQPISGKKSNWHHPYPKRFSADQQYPDRVPIIHVHQACHNRWHRQADPSTGTRYISDLESYLNVARNTRFGWGIFWGKSESGLMLNFLPILIGPLHMGIVPRLKV